MPQISEAIPATGYLTKQIFESSGQELVLLPADVTKIINASSSGSIAREAEEGVVNKIKSLNSNLVQKETKFGGNRDNGIDAVLTSNTNQISEILMFEIKSSIQDSKFVPRAQQLDKGYGGYVQTTDEYVFGINGDAGIVAEMKKSYTGREVNKTAILLENNKEKISKWVFEVDKRGKCWVLKVE